MTINLQSIQRARDEWFHWLLSVELAAYPACRPVARLYQRRLAGDEPSQAEWDADDAARIRIASAYVDCLRRNGIDPALASLDADVCRAVGEDGAALDMSTRLDMSTWHCGTSHCRAGWAVVVSGELGRALEASVGTEIAARAIYLASTGNAPDFFAEQGAALADIRRCGVGT